MVLGLDCVKKKMPKLPIEQIIELILPVNCLGCGGEGNWLCDDCQVASGGLDDDHRL